MGDIHDQVHLFSDGELVEAEADAFRLHLGTCARCQAALHDILQADHALSRAKPAPVFWKRREFGAALTLLAAMLIAVVVWRRQVSRKPGSSWPTAESTCA